jgi:hypothetical protein
MKDINRLKSSKITFYKVLLFKKIKIMNIFILEKISILFNYLSINLFLKIFSFF